MTNYRAGITSLQSRTTHVVAVRDDFQEADMPAYVRAACGQPVMVRPMKITEASEVCMRCRRAAKWPMVTSFVSHGIKFTDNWATKTQTNERIEN